MKQPTAQPLVSIIMHVHNDDEFLRDGIGSILNQTYPNWELLIVNDHSTDATRTILTTYKKRFSCINVFSLRQHKGLSAAMNLAFAHAKGTYIARMNAEDIAHPTRLAKQVAYLLSHPKTVVVGSHAAYLDKTNTIIGQKTVPLSHKAIDRDIGVSDPLIFGSCMINRLLLPSKKRLYADCLKDDDEYLTFFSLLSSGQFANLKDPLIACHLPSFQIASELQSKPVSLKTISSFVLFVISLITMVRKSFVTLPSFSFSIATEG